MRTLIAILLLGLCSAASASEAPKDTTEPSNPLERHLLQAQSGEGSVGGFLDRLVDAKVVVLSKNDVLESSSPEQITPLVLPGNDEHGKRLAIFTSPEMAQRVAKTYPKYRYGIETEFVWILAHTSPGLGLAINPGWELGMTIPSYGVLRLRERYQHLIEDKETTDAS